MYQFKAYFWNNTVCINGKGRYFTNEILNQCLNLDLPDLEAIRGEIQRIRSHLILQEDAGQDFINRYDSHAQRANQLMHTVDDLLRTITLYADNMNAETINGDKLFDCLNAAYPYWEGGDDDESIFNADKGFSDETANGFEAGDGENSAFYHMRFFPKDIDLLADEADVLLEIEQANQLIDDLFDRYLGFIDDLLRVKYVFSDFLDHYLHVKGKFLNEHETAKAYSEFMKGNENRLKPYQQFRSSGAVKFDHAVLKDEKGREILCDEYSFNTLGSFLYLDFFTGLKIGYLPKRCLHCGKYFLLQGGKYSDYCGRPLKEDDTKTCRDVGARRRYDDKCKTDPVWLTYNRAYKAHYARHMKRKMTVPEFEQWSRYAVELRTKVLSGELPFEEYQQKIKK